MPGMIETRKISRAARNARTAAPRWAATLAIAGCCWGLAAPASAAEVATKVVTPDSAGKTVKTKVVENPHDWLVKHPTITRLLELHNQERGRYGLAPLALDTQMCLAAQKHAVWMGQWGGFQHSGMGYRENIFHGVTTPEAAVQGWIYSPGHHSNMLSGFRVGFGYTVQNGRPYWVAVFQ